MSLYENFLHREAFISPMGDGERDETGFLHK